MKPIKKWKQATKWIVCTLGVLIIAFIGFTAYGFIVLNNAIDKTYEPVNRIPSNITVPNIVVPKSNAKEVKSYLILGLDCRPNTNDKGRTDTIMLAIVNDRSEEITLMSIPRDTYVEIAGKGYKDKINHAYQYGLETTIATVENFTEIPIDNYVLFTFDGFVKSIDAMGGVKVNVDKSIANNSIKDLGKDNKLIEGEMLLDGNQALYFSRFRYDAQGDYGRNDRQQQVLKAILDQNKSLFSTTKLNEILNIIGSDVRTDITSKEMLDLALQMLNYSSEDIKQVSYNAYSDRFGEQNLWYVVVPEEERVRVSNILKESLTK